MDRDVTRVVVVACPDWPAQAAVLDRVERGIVGGALAVVSAQRVVARTRSAGAEGIAVGMRTREAQGILPGLIVEAVNPQRDRTSFEPLVRGVCEIAPLVEVTEPGMVLVATQGPSRYFGGDEALAQRLQRIIGEATNGRIIFGIGIADGRLAATVAAHHSAHTGSPVVVETGRSAKLLADLGVGVLGEHCGVDPQTISLLQRLGLRRLGDLVAIREATLVARFGPLGAQLHRLARGLDRHPPIVIAPPPLRITTHRTEEPVEDVGVVVNLARTLAEDLVAHLHAHALQCVRIHVSLVCDHGETSERLWYQPEGLSAAAIAERVRWQMEAFVASRIPTSGVVVIRLDPVGLEPANGRQLGLWGARSQADEDAHKAIAELTAALGAHAVRVPLWRGGRDPAEVFELTPAALVDLERRGDAVEVSREWSGALPSPSPSIVFEDRCEIEVHDAHDRQVSVSGRHELSAPPTRVIIDRRRCRVRSWAGPWPIEERWWDGLRRRRIVRMQLVIEDPPQGHKALLVILDNGRWSVSAEYR
ncbi:MAG: hypothetical protein ACKOEK_05315 [Actinomycetota bacterium]